MNAGAASAGFGGRGAGGGAAYHFSTADVEGIQAAQEAMIKNVGSRTLYHRGGVGIDSQGKADAKPTIVKLFSPEYFELMKKDAELGQVLALGGKIMVLSGGTVYQIEE